jgi:CRISPR system Cascade subunit CasD
MPTLRLCLGGPMQAWGTRSRFSERDTDIEPSKSGVLGLLCAAMGIDRADWPGLEPLAELRMGVRVDQPGVLRHDYQTAQEPSPGRPRHSWATSVTTRYYLADAVFLVGLAGEDHELLDRADQALRNPVWPLYLGRKPLVPSRPVFIDPGVVDADLEEALRPAAHQYLGTGSAPPTVRVAIESRSRHGSLRMDQPIACFAERKYGARYIETAAWTWEV